MDTILSYLRQPSTWRGLITVLGTLGVVVSPELSAEIVATCIGVVGIIEVVRNEKKK